MLPIAQHDDSAAAATAALPQLPQWTQPKKTFQAAAKLALLARSKILASTDSTDAGPASGLPATSHDPPVSSRKKITVAAAAAMPEPEGDDADLAVAMDHSLAALSVEMERVAEMEAEMAALRVSVATKVAVVTANYARMKAHMAAVIDMNALTV